VQYFTVLLFQDNTYKCHGLVINNLTLLLQNLVENAPEGKGWVSMVSVTFRSYHSVLISDQTILVHLLLCLKKNFKHAVEHYLSIISSTSDKQINYAFVCTCFILMHLTYTLCLKNIPDIFSCNSRKHCRIFIMFGTHVTEKVSNQYLYSFPPHLTSASALPEIMQ